jgi:membrane associated rhomboid family serine protease
VEPVITPSGFIFEKSVIEAHLASHGPTCPLSGLAIAAHELRPVVLYSPNPMAMQPMPMQPMSMQPMPMQPMAMNPRLSFYQQPLPGMEAPGMIPPYRYSSPIPSDTSAIFSSPQSSTAVDLPEVGKDAPLERTKGTPGESDTQSQSSKRHRPYSTLLQEGSGNRENALLNVSIMQDSELANQLTQQSSRYGNALNESTSSDRLQTAIVERRQQQTKPWFIYLVTLLQVIGVIYTLVLNFRVMGTPFQLSTPVNYMLGPSTEVLIQSGARFAPCMRTSSKLPPVPSLAPPTDALACQLPTGKKTSNPAYNICTFRDYCGNFIPSSVSDYDLKANQWFRFVLPIFLHAGVVHFIMNIIFQMTSVKSLESDWGAIRIGVIYMASGIFGFSFGGAFGDELSPSVGCSGALFGMIACLLIDHIQNWKLIHHPTYQLIRMLFVIAVTFFIGLFPAIDNFSHIGGFIMGLLLGVASRPNIDLAISSFESVKPPTEGKKLLFGMSIVNVAIRIVCLVLAVILLSVIITIFYDGNGNDRCTWCKYIDCLPMLGECSVGAKPL